MFEWLLLAGLIGCFLAIREDVKRQVGEEEKKLVSEIKNLEYKLENQKAEVRRYIEMAKKKLDFDSCRIAHHNSHQAAKTAREILKRENRISKILNKGLTRVNNQLVASMGERDKLPPYSDERELKHKEVESGKKLQSSLNKEISSLKKRRESIIGKIKELDKDTHDLKIKIRDNFGRGGQIWYDRIQEKHNRLV